MYGDPERTRLIAHTAAFVALITLGGWLSIPFLPVPITLQTLFVLLAGAILKRRGVVPVGLYVLLGALNFPVFHSGLSGVGVLLGPTGGYILGFIPGALIIGLAYERASPAIRVGGIVAANLSIYTVGILWLLYSTGISLPYALVFGMAIFIPGDFLKGIGVYLTAKRLG
ncbi:MAG: biotin transporter BioY [Methanomicrobiales archaeon]|nr:biotin transporter BioY [Methanomicrobiales archaeon]